MNSGYGICGHKNFYSTGVKIGNYVEDRIGTILSAQSQSHPISTDSETQRNYGDPRLKVIPQLRTDNSINIAKGEIDKTLLREGLSYGLIFQHGPQHMVHNRGENMKTDYTISSMAYGKEYNVDHKRALSESKYLDIRKFQDTREKKLQFITTSTTLFPPHN